MLLVCERDRQALINRLPPGSGAQGLGGAPRRARAPGRAGRRESSGAKGDKGPVFAITGNLGYFVNVGRRHLVAARRLAAVRRPGPDARVVIAGDRPAPALRARSSGPGPG